MKMKKVDENTVNTLSRVSKPINLLFNFIFAILAALCIIPVIFVFMISISAEQSLATYGYKFLPKLFSLSAYEFLWNEKGTILQALFISIIVTVLGTLIGLLLTTTMGYVLSRRDYKLKGFFTWVVFIPMIFNGGLVASYVINTQVLGLRDSIWALILPLAVSSFNVIISKTFFRTTIPDSIIESAKIEGASHLDIFIRIVMPISKPVLATLSLFLSFGYWNDWFQASLYINDISLS